LNEKENETEILALKVEILMARLAEWIVKNSVLRPTDYGRRGSCIYAILIISRVDVARCLIRRPRLLPGQADFVLSRRLGNEGGRAEIRAGPPRDELSIRSQLRVPRGAHATTRRRDIRKRGTHCGHHHRGFLGGERCERGVSGETWAGRTVGVSSRARKPPCLLLPKFDGSILLFKFFWDQFEATIHRHEDLTDITKLIHLKSCLSGPAMKVVKGGVTICVENYLEVFQTLKNQFHRLPDGVEYRYWGK
ncbi:hypothetical protein T11_9583, partial [Trichinella zimbabwensis]